MDADVIADVVFDGAVDVSATFVAHVDDQLIPSRLFLNQIRGDHEELDGTRSGVEVNDNGGAHVHGAVDDYVCVYVNARVNAHVRH